MPLEHRRNDLAGELRPVLALARLECVAALSAQLEELVESAVAIPRHASDPHWWASELRSPARALDDGWVRRCGPALRRGSPLRVLRHPSGDVTEVTYGTSQPAAGILAAAAAAALARTRRRTGSRPVARPAGAASAGTLALVSGSGLSAVTGAWRLLGASGPGIPVVCAGLVLLGGVGVIVRVRAVRAARARQTALRVRTAVLAAAERELLRRSLNAEPAAGTPEPPGTRVRAARHRIGAGRAA